MILIIAFYHFSGMDIKENYLNVLPLVLFQDAQIWVNAGEQDYAHTFAEVESQLEQLVDYQKIDLSHYDYEIYLYEKPFFNTPYLFIAIAMEHKTNVTFQYIRKDGPYWEGLKKHRPQAELDAINGNEVYNPHMDVVIDGVTQTKEVFGLPLYGHHHPDRAKFGLNGGACPSRGGDWGRYPFDVNGGGWPINYQEITPLCDGFLIDVKAYANLFVETWADPKLAMGNAGFGGKKIIHYRVDANKYGEYTDKYLVDKRTENPHKLVLTPDGKVVQKNDEKHRHVIIPIEYKFESHLNDFHAAPEVGIYKSRSLKDWCPKHCPAHKPCDDPQPVHKHPEEEQPTCPAPKKEEPKEWEKHDDGHGHDHGHDGKEGEGKEVLDMTYKLAKMAIGMALVLV